MTPKIKVSLGDSGCQKPNCAHRFSIPHRHHMRSEKQWINLWTRPGSPRPVFRGDLGLGERFLRLLRERYYAFRPQDTVRICEWHHVEIHMEYRIIIGELSLALRKPSSMFTVEEAIRAMLHCRLACQEWIKQETPGMDPKKATRLRLWGRQKP